MIGQGDRDPGMYLYVCERMYNSLTIHTTNSTNELAFKYKGKKINNNNFQERYLSMQFTNEIQTCKTDKGSWGKSAAKFKNKYKMACKPGAKRGYWQ